jgi:hypothetical protein
MKQYKSHKSVMRSIKRIVDGKSKPKKVMNDTLKRSLINIIDDEITLEARAEALKLLLKADQKEIGDFLYYYHSDSVVTPSVIDSIKDRLVKEGKMKFKKGDHFGLLSNPEFEA